MKNDDIKASERLENLAKGQTWERVTVHLMGHGMVTGLARVAQVGGSPFLDVKSDEDGVSRLYSLQGAVYSFEFTDEPAPRPTPLDDRYAEGHLKSDLALLEESREMLMRARGWLSQVQDIRKTVGTSSVPIGTSVRDIEDLTTRLDAAVADSIPF